MRDSLLVFGSPHILQPEIDEVRAVMESGWLGTGPRVARFQERFADYLGVEHAVAVNSCTAALHLALIASGLRPGDEVITTALTFCATINSIIHAGATPILADVDPRTMNVDPARVEDKITERTRAILIVHFAGHPCDMDALLDIVRRHDLILIEDCAHAIETEHKGRKAGTFGDFGCFSFYVTKNVMTGEGGMVVTSSAEAAARIQVLGLHGMSKDAWQRFGDEGYKHYQVVEAGFKYNMMDLQAAIGLHQLERVESNWQRRREIWRRYNEAFEELPAERPVALTADCRHAHHLYTLRLDPDDAPLSRDTFLDEMTARNIGVGVHYLSIPEHPYYQQAYEWAPPDYPNAMAIGRSTVSLPLSSKLTDTDVGDVIDAVSDLLSARCRAQRNERA